MKILQVARDRDRDRGELDLTSDSNHDQLSQQHLSVLSVSTLVSTLQLSRLRKIKESSLAF